MKLYAAAAESALKELSAHNMTNILISMANGEKKIPQVPTFFGDNYDLIIDSGAFSYYKKGGIKLDTWIAKAKKLQMPNSQLIGLDVIGNPAETLENYNEIIKTIPDAIPTFHVGSDISYLKKYLNNTDRIAIGGMVPYKSEIEKLKRFLTEIFKLFGKEALPRFHAFGYFSPEILENFPFWSADASTWQNYSRFGEFHVFKKMQYLRMKSINVETFSPYGKTLDELNIYLLNTPEAKLESIKNALHGYEKFLTYLWNKREIKFNHSS